MTQKVAYLWGSISSFSGPLAALLLKKGWHVHVATKAALNLFTLAPLDLNSSAQVSLERSLGGHEQFKAFQDRLRFLEGSEPLKGTTYDALIFSGLPPNFDEPRAPRAVWAAAELMSVARLVKSVPVFIVSSLWGGAQPDGVVPEELEFSRRKPKSHWEGVCQQYENRVLRDLSHFDAPWHLIRLPMISGASLDGRAVNFSGLFSLLRQLTQRQAASRNGKEANLLALGYNPDATLWFLPVDAAVHLFWRILEDGSRPRICNLVSTETTLNREWLQHAARALGYQGATSVESDAFALPGILRRMLTDNILVKTRNLFEVAGRYHITPVKLDQTYFDHLLSFARAENWGEPVPRQEAAAEFSGEMAGHYFEQFLPGNMSAGELQELTAHGATIAFQIDAPEPLSWLLKNVEGKATIERVEPAQVRGRIRISADADTMMRLAAGKVSLPRALLLRQARLAGPVLDALRFANAFARFLKAHEFDPQALGSRPALPTGARP